MAGIADYRRALAAQETRLRTAMASGKGSAFELALNRVTWEIMRDELTNFPNSVIVWDKMGPEPGFGFQGADRWAHKSLLKANERISPQYGSREQVARKYEEYLDFGLKMLKWGQVKQELIVDKYAGRQYLIFGASPLVSQIMQLLMSQLMEWFRAQPNTAELINRPPVEGLATLLTQRPDLSTLLRIAQTLPLDVEISDVPVDRPAVVEAIELAIGLIPIVGSAVAAYEIWAGEDLFGYKLTDLERGILGACILLPAAGRLVKGGRALYTEARLVRMYGRDAAAWTKAMGASGRAMAEREALAAITRAEQTLRVQKSVAGTLARDAASALPRLTHGAGAVSRAVDQKVVDLLRELQAAHPILDTLDALSLERVLAKGPNVDHLKGQLLEELVESRLVPWLATREGGFALGIAVPAGKKLEFIPGHLIRDISSRQISDGMLVFREGDHLVVCAVFEAKAGKSAARELSLKRNSISGLTRGERDELRAYAKDVWREQRDEAVAAGKAFKKSVEDVEKEFIQSELGGQVRRDVERLAATGGNLTRIRIGSQEIAVKLSPTQTKFFGVLPRDVRASTIEAQLKDSGFAYEILGVDIKAAKLKDIAALLQPLAEAMAKAAP